MDHLLIAYDILVIIIGFAALSNAVVWALRTGQNDLGNFSIVYALFSLMMIILVLGKYLFVNVAAYPGRTWYTIWGAYESLDFTVVTAAVYYFLEAHQFRFGRRVTTFSDVVMDQAGLVDMICRLNGNRYHHQWQRKMRLQDKELNPES